MPAAPVRSTDPRTGEQREHAMREATTADVNAAVRAAHAGYAVPSPTARHARRSSAPPPRNWKPPGNPSWRPRTPRPPSERPA